MRTVLTCMLVAALFQQQAPPRDRVASSPTREGTGVIKGRVYDRETGAPIANAAVTLSVDFSASARGTPTTRQPDGTFRTDPPRQARSDVQGRFVFERLPADTYTLSSNPPEYKVVYLPQAYGASRPSDPTRPPPRRPLTLAEGQTLDNIDLPLWRSMAVTGHVTDELGEPMANVTITANIAGSWQRVGSRGPYPIVTDDRGAFRMFGMTPGRYVICASPQGPFVRGNDDVTERYVKTCAPSAASEAEAQVVELSNGDFGDVEIRMGRGRTHRITGTAVDSQGKPVVMVSIVRSEDNNGFTSSGSHAQSDGGFTFSGLTAGDYTVVARAGNTVMPTADAELEIGSVPVHLDGADVENILVVTSKGATVSGRVLFEASAPPAAVKGMRVMLRPAPGAGVAMFGPASNAEVTADLTFTLKGVFGPAAVNVSGLPGGWIVKSVRLGGDDVTDRAIDFRGRDRLEVVLSNRPAMLFGHVVLDAGEVSTDYRVLLIPVDREQWTAVTALRSAQLNVAPSGTFKIGGLRAGEYFAAVIRQEDMPPPTNSAATLEKLSRSAQRVTLMDDEIKEIELTIPR